MAGFSYAGLAMPKDAKMLEEPLMVTWRQPLFAVLDAPARVGVEEVGAVASGVALHDAGTLLHLVQDDRQCGSFVFQDIFN